MKKIITVLSLTAAMTIIAGFISVFSVKIASASGLTKTKNSRMKKNLVPYGKKLYYSKIMANNTLSCATCHVQSIGTYANCGKKGGLMLSLNNIDKKLAERNRLKHSSVTLRHITEKCFKVITGRHLSAYQIHALDTYVRTLK